MALVDYGSDSDASDTEAKPVPPPQPVSKASNTNFSIDRANPQKIQVKLNHVSKTHDDEPAPKRARLTGGGAGGGFNALLPPPKRTTEQAAAKTKAPARKVFSLKTGAEAAFSRESDAELRALFDEDGGNGNAGVGADVTIPDVPKKATILDDEVPKTNGNAFMFKPLSVSHKKKKRPLTSAISKGPSPTPAASGPTETTSIPSQSTTTVPPKQKMSLFSAHSDTDIEPLAPDPIPAPTHQDEDPYDSVTADYATISSQRFQSLSAPQDLDSIATDLNLTTAQRRQLFGRNGNDSSANISKIVNFNTDAEYAANEVLRGDAAAVAQAQHNPVRAIASGKHSLRQLVSSAQGQKEALEESFAAGRRNKREAGNKYGW
ncbi:uncharacterized protein AB675_11344 [Cyphellophora attinorum]|uniref:Mitotic checkpoint regulator, MAD2B-interacting-domain-containing protein n=1 Tax=Cyphellophora attinorum TaxID=1664694 RepID=A0A0N1H996_9EURO|nr:uncharacterized protein AB675_11344 [Phialophora attinorum]KPI40063.1 hypothetical protein AB675_11344 [Phialophora attinorum]